MTSEDDHRQPRVGLVLSGGGARGAYEVGVLRYIRERLGRPTPFHVITGSSVGAINGAYIAATCDRPRAQVRMLSRVWSDLNLDVVFKMGWQQIRALPQVLFGRHLPKNMTHGETIGGLVDAGFIDSTVRSRIPWHGITENLHRGHLQAFSCSATELATGTTTVFVQTRSGRLPHWPDVPGQMVVHTPISAAHTLASAAIPVLFPAVRVGDQFYVDGSLRQNTPIRPAMRLGANRLLVIGLRMKDAGKIAVQQARERARTIYPNAVFMLGKMLNALMLDKLEADLARIHRTNQLVEAGQQLYGDAFAQDIGAAISGRAGKPYVKIEVELIQPSRNLGQLAHEVIRTTGLKRYSGVMARWLRRTMEAGDEMHENDLASYVLWDPDYVRMLMELGYADARARHDEIAALFEPVS